MKLEPSNHTSKYFLFFAATYLKVDPGVKWPNNFFNVLELFSP